MKNPKFAKHLKRVTAQVSRSGGPTPETNPKATDEARIVLNEMTKNGIVLFSSTPVRVGEEISIDVELPKKLSTKGRILACNDFQLNQNIVSPRPYRYRILVTFAGIAEEQRKELDQYYELVQKEVGGLPRVA